jgi:uncharacterized delta-60 repeat protein
MKKICGGLILLFALTGIVAAAPVNQEWVARWNDASNSTDYGRAVGVDAAGNVYTTGYAYNPTSANYDITTVKYNSTGVQQWVQTYNGPGNSTDYPYAIAVSPSGDVYIAGYAYGSSSNPDMVTLKYNTSGVFQWAQLYSGTSNSSDYGYDIAIDASGNAYTAGYTSNTGTSYDMTVVKYSSAGVFQWAGIYNGPMNSTDYAYSVAVDGSGNVYMGGYSYQSATTIYDYTVVKYNSAGVRQWVGTWNDPVNYYDYGRDVDVDGSGNVYMAGYSNYYSSGYYAIVTVKWNSSGVFQWAQPFVGTAGTSYTNYGYYIKVTSAGNVYTAGYGYDNNGGTISPDIEIVKYNTAGTQQWSNHYNGPMNSTDQMTAPGGLLALDAAGNAYACAYISYGSASTVYDFATIKYDATTGAQQWVMRYDNGLGSSYPYDYQYWVTVDASNNVYTCGYGYGLNSGVYSYDFTTIKYSQYADVYVQTPLLTGTTYSATQVWCGAAITPYDTVGNSGPGAATTVFTQCNIGPDGYSESQTIANLASGAKARNVFVNWTPSLTPGKVYNRRDTTYAASPTDPNLSNNWVIASYSTVYDGQAVSITNPPASPVCGTSYTPQATVRNNSPTGNATFSVTCTISPGGYSSTKTASVVAAGGSMPVTFDPWTAGQTPNTAYTVTVTCQTTGDVNTGNNTVSTTVTTVYDGQTVSIDDPPTNPWCGATYAPKATVKNNSASGSATFSVTCVIQGGYTSTQTVTSLAAGASTQVTFTNWTASRVPNTVSQDTVYCQTTGDNATGNNTLTRTLTTIYDGQAVSIDDPPVNPWCGATYAPKATVKNNSALGAADFSVTCVIVAGYTSIKTVTNLAAGATIQVTFDNWTASRVPNTAYTVTTTCQTTGDNNTGNNTATSTSTTIYDGQTVSIDDPPASPWCGATYAPKATVKNNSALGAADFSITCTSSPDGYSSTKNVSNLAFGSTIQVTFDNWTASRVPNTAYTFTTTCQTTGDNNTANNTQTKNITTIYDGQTVSITAPPDTVLTGTTYNPAATVKNNSAQGAADFSVSCTITPGGYSDTQSVTNLSAGVTIPVTFSAWTSGLTPGVTYTMTVTCQTTGDNNTANNTQSKSIFAYGDVGATEAVSPLDTVYVNTEYNPIAKIKNFTSGLTEGFPVTCQILDGSGGIVYTDTHRDSLDRNEEKLETFIEWMVGPAVGVTYEIQVFTQMTGDCVPGNDKITWEVVSAAQPSLDVGVASLDDPTGNIQVGKTYQPKATVRNFGTNTATFNVTCTIGGYTSTKGVADLAKNVTQQITFDNWTPLTASSYTMTVITLLADANPHNDTMSQTLNALGIDELVLSIPRVFALEAVRPNPFSSAATIRCALPVNTTMSLTIYDITGALVKTLASGAAFAGYKSIIWDGRDNGGKRLANGLYFIRMETPKYTAVKKIVLMR